MASSGRKTPGPGTVGLTRIRRNSFHLNDLDILPNDPYDEHRNGLFRGPDQHPYG